eukprot:scaffold81389_cov30-Tisochrysis_lutea.AAC.7
MCPSLPSRHSLGSLRGTERARVGSRLATEERGRREEREGFCGEWLGKEECVGKGEGQPEQQSAPGKQGAAAREGA